ncbi:glycosyltransferase [Persephonella sp.]
MKILFYLHNLWEISATTRLAVDLATVLKDKYSADIEFAVNKINQDDIKNLPFKRHVLNRKGEFGKARAIRELVEQNNYDVVMSYMLTQNIILSIAKWMAGQNSTVYIGSVHNSDNFMKNSSVLKLPYRYLMKKLYENLDGIIVVSKAVEEDVHRAYLVNKNKMKVIYNYIDIEKIRRLTLEPLSEKETEFFSRPVVINVGRMETQKGQEYLIRAFRLIKDEIPEAGLAILGDGSLKNKLEELARSLDIQSDVYMPGYVENPFKYMKHSKIFAFPSLWEGVGNVVLEAQAVGLPVVAFNSQGGHVDVLKDSGILVPERDHIKMAEEIISLLKDKSRWQIYSNLSLDNIKNYSVERKAEEYYRYFMQKMEGK